MRLGVKSGTVAHVNEVCLPRVEAFDDAQGFGDRFMGGVRLIFMECIDNDGVEALQMGLFTFRQVV